MLSVALGWISPASTDALFTRSVAHLLAADKGRTVKEVLSVESGPLVHNGRNILTRQFLEGKADALFMVDADMGFEPDVLPYMMKVARAYPDRIVGGLCFGFDAQTRRVFPTAYRRNGDLYDNMDVRPLMGSIFECDATGAAALLIPRKVLRGIGDPWWPAPTHTHGEDILFFEQHGIKPLIATGAQFTHAKRLFVGAQDFGG